MRKIAVLISFMFTCLLFGQTITIEWQGLKDNIREEDHKVKLPFFKNGVYDVANDIPIFNYSRETDGPGRISISNVSYSVLSPSEIGDLNRIFIPDSLDYHAKINKGGDQFYMSVSMIPFVKENGQIKKVNSFQIIQEQGLSVDDFNSGTLDPATSSVLKSGDWYKIKITKSGIYRLDKAFFDQNNIPTNFDPRTLKIYGNGGRMVNMNPGDFRYGALQENAIHFAGEDDGSFDSGDYILFYAQGPHDWYRKDNSTLTSLTHRFNMFSDEAYYFITFGGVDGKRVQDQNIAGNPTETFNKFDEYVFYELDSINLNDQGRQWGGESFRVENSQSFTLTGSAPAASGGQALARFRLLFKQAMNVTYSGSIDGQDIGNGAVQTYSGDNSFLNNFQVGEFQKIVNLSGNTFTFNISVNSANNPGAFSFLDYLEVKYEANLVFNGSQMHFRKLKNLNDGNIYGFSLSGAQKVWNISDITNASNVVNSGGIYKYQSTHPDFLNEFIAFNESAAMTEVEYVGQVANQNLRALKDIDYVVVTHPNFLSEAARIANFRIQNDGVKAAVVTTEQIYNEFSSGAQDISGIRDFLKHLRDSGSPLKNVLLFGGASFDYKDRIENNSNFVPAYISFNSVDIKQSFTTDDYFTMLDDSDVIVANTNAPYEFYKQGSSQMDIAVGRFPADNMQEAKTMVDKTLSYYMDIPGAGSSFGDWRTKFLLVVDDDWGAVPFHETIENTSAAFITENIKYATLRKGYLDSFTLHNTSAGYRYPQVNEIIGNAFNLGSALIMYFGHGGPRSWSQTRVITYEEINSFANFSGLYSRLPVVMTITCEFTVWDIPSLPSAGVYMFKAPHGGASAMVTTSRPVYISYGESFNEKIVEQVLKVQGHKYQSLGIALTNAKKIHPSTNNLSVNLLGDPMLSVARPPRKIRITKINGEDANDFDGVFRALDFVEIEGEVLNDTGNVIDKAFNGKATASLFDKPVNKSTLNNMRKNISMPIMDYQEQVNPIFKGGTNVKNGKFKFEFYVPKDINYEVGEGKLMIYAHNNVIDGVETKLIKVGDMNPDGLDDDEGPVIGLFMNNLNFVDGGITNRNPYLVACLVDSTGINTSGVAIGHDITSVLDKDLEGTLVLNEFYEGGDNNPCTNPQVKDYQKGQVTYRFNNLELGEHQIVFKAWDINNNSSEQTLDFVVMEEGSEYIYIEKLLNWPNPFTNQTYFHFEHNCDSELEVMVQIYTISGKLVKTIRQTVSAEPWREGYRTGRFAIPWDGLDDFGDKIGKGVYIYRLSARGIDPETCKGTAAAVEKLVILK